MDNSNDRAGGRFLHVKIRSLRGANRTAAEYHAQHLQFLLPEEVHLARSEVLNTIQEVKRQDEEWSLRYIHLHHPQSYLLSQVH